MIHKAPELPSGNYAITRSADTPDEREDCRRALRRQGCKSVRFETHAHLLVAHGYIARIGGLESL